MTRSLSKRLNHRRFAGFRIVSSVAISDHLPRPVAFLIISLTSTGLWIMLTRMALQLD